MNSAKLRDRSNLVKQLATKAGFDYCGISSAEFLEQEAPKLENWLKNNNHGQMRYMENHFDKRLDPRILVPGAKSVISLMVNYYPEKEQSKNAPKISRYAYGDDYHKVIKDMLFSLFKQMKTAVGNIEGRVFVDSAPVLEKAWAKNSGLGWVGKNTNLIKPSAGSYFFLAEIISDLELEADGPIKDYCGTCTRCIDACPTDALATPYVLDAQKCISYFTIELKEAIPEWAKDKMENWMFGCDICQEVCPWNRFSKPHSNAALNEDYQRLEMSWKEWEELTENTFKEVFGKSAITRTGFHGIKRNLDFLT
jgi:epoxyqueuosine reductase